ncbi:hypothetical protein HDU89_006100 [Geranomyces variabilis]|nr:hypothetical protein HDU89_006100 [Geranomyces variabilis]
MPNERFLHLKRRMLAGDDCDECQQKDMLLAAKDAEIAEKKDVLLQQKVCLLLSGDSSMSALLMACLLNRTRNSQLGTRNLRVESLRAQLARARAQLRAAAAAPVPAAEPAVPARGPVPSPAPPRSPAMFMPATKGPRTWLLWAEGNIKKEEYAPARQAANEVLALAGLPRAIALGRCKNASTAGSHLVLGYMSIADANAVRAYPYDVSFVFNLKRIYERVGSV